RADRVAARAGLAYPSGILATEHPMRLQRSRTGLLVRVLLVAFVTLVGSPAEAATGERRLDARAPRQLDTRAVREEVRRVAVATYTGQTVGEVRCPRKAPRREGFVFFCYVDLATQVVPVRVTQLDDLGRVKLDVTAAVLTKAQLEQLVAGSSTLPGTVDCG